MLADLIYYDLPLLHHAGRLLVGQRPHTLQGPCELPGAVPRQVLQQYIDSPQRSLRVRRRLRRRSLRMRRSLRKRTRLRRRRRRRSPKMRRRLRKRRRLRGRRRWPPWSRPRSRRRSPRGRELMRKPRVRESKGEPPVA